MKLTKEEIVAAWNEAVPESKDKGIEMYLHLMQAVADAQYRKCVLSLESVRSEALEEAAKVAEAETIPGYDMPEKAMKLSREQLVNAAVVVAIRSIAKRIRALRSPARVAEGEITGLKSRVTEAAKAWLIRYEDEVRDEAEEAPCKNLVAAVDALVAAEVIAAGVAEEKDVHSIELRK